MESEFSRPIFQWAAYRPRTANSRLLLLQLIQNESCSCEHGEPSLLMIETASLQPLPLLLGLPYVLALGDIEVPFDYEGLNT